MKAGTSLSLISKC